MSIYNKIRIIFLVSALFVSAFFAASFYIQKVGDFQDIQKRYVQTSFFIHKYFRDSIRNNQDVDLSLFLKESSFRKISDTDKIHHILKESKVIIERRVLRSKLKILRGKHRRYLFLQSPRFKILLEDEQTVKIPWQLLGWYLLSLLFLLGLYLWLTKSLRPLHTLQKQIEKVARGDMSVSTQSRNHDEIASVANAFDAALRKIESLIDSRQLFLRTIMHELKTPIGKGRLLNTFLQDDHLARSYDAVFERLELLIDEFSKIEQMLSSSYVLKESRYNVRDIIDQALELMIMDEKEIEKQVHIIEKSTLVLHTDFELLSLALKNLIDNAIKYSSNASVEIIIEKDSLSIINEGEQFTQEIESYFTPFHGKGNGFGLGLYIVKNILDQLSFALMYRYEKGKNIFIIH